jgi:replicative DNA helicase
MPESIQPVVRAALPATALIGQAMEVVINASLANKMHGLVGLPTGIDELDKHVSGLQKGLHIVAAEPGAGKTALALQLVRAAARVGKTSLYVTFDEFPERLLIKLLSAESRLCATDILNGRVEPEEVKRAFEDHRETLSRILILRGDQATTEYDIEGQFRDRGGNGLIVVDYLQPMAASMAASQKIDMRLMVGGLAQALRAVSERAGCPVVLVSAQNRAGQGSASMTSLRESSDLEYSADSILLLTRDEAKDGFDGQYHRELTLAKNRFGPAGKKIDLVFDARYMTFRSGLKPGVPVDAAKYRAAKSK